MSLLRSELSGWLLFAVSISSSRCSDALGHGQVKLPQLFLSFLEMLLIPFFYFDGLFFFS